MPKLLLDVPPPSCALFPHFFTTRVITPLSPAPLIPPCIPLDFILAVKDKKRKQQPTPVSNPDGQQDLHRPPNARRLSSDQTGDGGAFPAQPADGFAEAGACPLMQSHSR